MSLAIVQDLYAQADQPSPFPYSASVISDNAIVRSGPGKTHYATDRLQPGTEVQVFRHDPGGWIAIRPPERSFSLVQRDEVDLYENGLARVKQPETVAWVGTRLNAVDRPMWQVKLRQGEVLDVLGVVDRQQYKLDEKEPDWVQVKPPKGEFRWIKATHVRPMTANELAPSIREFGDGEIDEFQINSGDPANWPDRGNNQGPTAFDAWDPGSGQGYQDSGEWNIEVEPNGATSNDFGASGDFGTSGLNGSNIPTASGGWKPARQAISNFTSQRSGFQAEKSSAGMYTGQWSNSGSNPNGSNNMSVSSGTLGSVPATNSSIRSGVFDAHDSHSSTNHDTMQNGMGSNGLGSNGLGLNGLGSNGPTLMAPSFATSSNSSLLNLEMRLTREMIKPPSEWDLVTLTTEVQQARSLATSQQDVEFIDRLLEKIQNCREIKAGYRATGGDAGPSNLQAWRNSPNQSYANGQGGNGLGRNGSVDQVNLLYDYDAHGILNELVRDGGREPSTYVLQDSNGRITHHVAAPPGLNLRRYLNQRVGIIGNRGFHQQLQLDHVTAERIVSIDALRR